MNILKNNKFKIAFLTVLIASGIGIYIFLQSLDALIASAIRKYGTEITGVAVNVSSVKLNTKNGSMTIRGLSLANPQGYSSAKAFELGEMSVAIDPKSITAPVIRIHEFNLVKPNISYETLNSISNFDAIQNNVNRFTSKNFKKSESSSGSASSGGEQKSSASANGKKMMIDHFSIVSAKVTASTVLTAGKPVTLTMPDIHLRGIGNGGGATPEAVVKQVMGAITQGVTQIVAMALRDAVKNTVKNVVGGGLKDVGGALKGVFQGLGQ